MGSGAFTLQPTSENHYSHWLDKTVPEVEWSEGLGVVPVIWRDHPIRFTFCYVFESRGEVAVFDPGYDTDEGWATLVDGLRAGGLTVNQVGLTVISHFHVDHWGMAERLRAHSGTRVALGEAEHRWYRDLAPAVHERGAVHAFFAGWGVPEEVIPSVASTYDYHEPIQRPTPEVLLRDRETLRVGDIVLEVRHTPGHSPGHIMLVDHRAKRLYSADHILPRITPNVSLNPFGQPDPLRSYLDSLAGCEELDDYEVFPGHEYRFRGVADRIRHMREGIAVRGREIAQAVGRVGAGSVWEVAKSLQWYRPWADFSPIAYRMALGETAAYLVYLGLAEPLGRGVLDFPRHSG